MIRKSTLSDLQELMELYGHARQFMRQTGNPNQWINGYPSAEIIEQDIRNGTSHVWAENGEIIAAFSLIPGEDPTYAQIYDGKWLNGKPYATIHRLANSGKRKSIAYGCIEWSFRQYGNLRADTHTDNRIMQHILEKTGFQRCGIILTHNGSPRIAYQKTRNADD